MSFITRCPACATAFKVVPDQLKISDGWVRCGQCQQVFNATLDLQPWSPVLEQAYAQPPEPRQPSQPSQPSAQPAVQTRAAMPESRPEPAWEPESVVPSVVPSAAPAQPEAQEPQPQVAQGSQPEVQGTTAPHQHPDDAALEPLAQSRPDTRPPTDAQHGPASAASPEPPAPRTAEPSFVRKAQRQALWQRPLVRLLLLVAVAALALLLGLQAATQWRAPLARAVPVTQPVLDALCQTLDCQQALPASATDVVIDSSVLLRLMPGVYGFQVVLRNQSALEVLSPAIELTLTDIHDQVLVRRVLLPHEWPRPTATLPAGAQWSLQFELAFDGIEGRVMTGYRAILFYP